jgi:hypothetical protein
MSDDLSPTGSRGRLAAPLRRRTDSLPSLARYTLAAAALRSGSARSSPARRRPAVGVRGT